MTNDTLAKLAAGQRVTWTENGFTADAKIIRAHSVDPDCWQVLTVSGTHWVPGAALTAQAPAAAEPVAEVHSMSGDYGCIKVLRQLVAFPGHKLYTAPQAAQQAAQAPEGWVPIEQAPEGELVVVGWRDESDPENPDRQDFDYLEDGCWMRHHDNHENYIMVGGPKLGPGPSEKAPYTHFMRVGPVPAARPQAEGSQEP